MIRVEQNWCYIYDKIKEKRQKEDREKAIKIIRLFTKRIIRKIIKFQTIVREKLVFIRKRRQDVNEWFRKKELLKAAGMISKCS